MDKRTVLIIKRMFLLDKRFNIMGAQRILATYLWWILRKRYPKNAIIFYLFFTVLNINYLQIRFFNRDYQK